MTGKGIIELKNVSLTYPSAEHPSLTDVDLSVDSGEVVVVIGPSGCGKTSVTRVINGLAEQYYGGKLTGSVHVDDLDVRQSKLYEIGRKVGSVFQDPRSQFFATLVEDEVAFGMENYGIDHHLLEERVNASLEQVKAENLKGKEVFPLSSGEKQKVAIASVGAVNPLAYVFDEPSANLDMKSADALGELINDLKMQGHAIVVAEHRIYYLANIADRFIYMQGGKIVRILKRAELLALSDGERERLGIRSPCIRAENNAPRRQRHIFKNGLEISKLSYMVGPRLVLDHLDLRVPSGICIALVGSNGVGKTTLARCICGLIKEKGGEIALSGESMNQRGKRRSTYFVMQNTDCQLFADSVAEELHLNRPDLSDSETRTLLDAYGLSDFKDAHPMTLSGGQKQRLAIAVAELLDVPVIVLDEPTSGLDLRSMRMVSKRLKELASRGKTVLVISHDYEFIASTCAIAVHLETSSCIKYLEMEESAERLLAALME